MDVSGPDCDVDLVFVLEASGSNSDNWIRVIMFLQRVLSGLDLSVVKAAVITYSEGAAVQFDLNANNN